MSQEDLAYIYLGPEITALRQAGVGVDFVELQNSLGGANTDSIKLADWLVVESPELALHVIRHESSHIETTLQLGGEMGEMYGGRIGPGYTGLQAFVRDELLARETTVHMAELMGASDFNANQQIKWIETIIARDPQNPANWARVFNRLIKEVEISAASYLYPQQPITDPSLLLPANLD